MFLQNNPENKTYSIGLDPSLSSFGSYFLPLNHDEWYGFTTMTDTKHGTDTRRILDVAEEILQSIANLPHAPAIAVFEDYGPINRTSGKVTQRAEICGILKHHLLRIAKLPLIMVPPPSLKQFATGKGNASKDMILDAAAKHSYYPESTDEADAFFLAKIGERIIKGQTVGVSFNRVNPDS
jgi:crossover junction endodeoxyribonuclease RuvC